MKKVLGLLMFLSVFVFSVGCASTTGTYKISLYGADGAKGTITDGKNFEDDQVKITWPVSGQPKGVDFILSNKSSKNIKIIWDEAALIGVDGMTQRVMHEGVKFTNRNESQPSTVIIKGASITDSVTPTNNVAWSDGAYYKGMVIAEPGWYVKPMFEVNGSTNEEMDAIKEKYKDKTFKILLPVQTDAKKTEYVFSFKIEDFIFERIQASKPTSSSGGSPYNN